MDIRRDTGIAMVVAVMAMMLMAALGVALILTTSTEVIIAANFRSAAEGLYAADGILERAIGDLLRVADWNPVLDGTLQSSFIDGSPGGVRSAAQRYCDRPESDAQHGELPEAGAVYQAATWTP